MATLSGFYQWLTDNFQSIIVNLFSSGVSFILGILATIATTRLFKQLRILRYRRLFGNSGHLTLITGDKGKTDTEEAAITSTDFLAITELNALLESAFPKSQRSIRSTSNLRDLVEINGTDIILVGGPNKNLFTRKMIQALRDDQRLKVEFQGHDIHVLGTTQTVGVIYDENHLIAMDHGFVYSFRNPFNDKYRVLIIAGCKGIGTLGAAKWVTGGGINRRIPLFSRRTRDLCFLIKAQANAGDLFAPQFMQQL